MISEAKERLSGKVTTTPTVHLPWLDNSTTQVWAKLECQQETGSFKFRGALNSLLNTHEFEVITASAGNHALALCRAAAKTHKRATIVAPENVSELKAKRISAEAHDLVFFGKDLAEATKEAIRMETISKGPDAQRGQRCKYISPYDDPFVAAGAGTLMFEAFEQAGHFDKVVVPLGGGGLTAAVSAWCERFSPSTQVICVHPKIFGRSVKVASGDLRLTDYLYKPAEATLCDGLAVQLARPTPFADILNNLVDDVIEVDEEDVLNGISMALRYQSLLLEGSSAATIAAALQAGHHEGRQSKTLLLFTGGNIMSSTVAKALVRQVDDPQTRRQLGLRNITNSSYRNGYLGRLAGSSSPSNGKDVENGSPLNMGSVESSNHSIPHGSLQQAIMFTLSQGLQDRVSNLVVLLHQRRQICKELSLDVDGWSEEMLDSMAQKLAVKAADFRDSLRQATNNDGNLLTRLPFWTLEERYRTILQVLAATESLCERASASNDQALRTWFFRTTSQHQTACNYDRYGVETLRAAELMFLRSIMPLSAVSAASVTLLLASSGMAAFQILWQFCTRHLQPGDSIVTPPYLYFEAMEQIESYSHYFRIHQCASFSAADIIRTSEEVNATAVFLDPLANIVGLPQTDLRQFFSLLSDRQGWDKRLVVIDGTMVSGGLPVFDWMNASKGQKPIVLYHESASKYAQLGLDIQMAGFCVAPSHLDESLRKIRRDIGSVLSGRAVASLPTLTPVLYQARMQLLTESAETLYNGLGDRLSHLAIIAFPQQWRDLGWRHGGALVTIEFRDAGLNNREGLDACIDLVLRSCEAARLPITKGVSFGFSTTRISASSSMAENSDPFLRISAGINGDETSALVVVLSNAILAYTQRYQEA